MSAAEALWAAHAVGVKVRLDGRDLLLEASAPPSSVILDRLARHKADIVAILRRNEGGTEAASSRPPCPSEIIERSALIEEADHSDCNAADRRALNKSGYVSWQAFTDAHRMNIATAINELPPPCTDSGHRIMVTTQNFLRSQWFPEAIKCGWRLCELFGVDAHAPLDRHEQWGLVVGLAWAPQLDDSIERIDAGCAVIRFRSGKTLKEKHRIERRFSPTADTMPWWKCSPLVCDVE